MGSDTRRGGRRRRIWPPRYVTQVTKRVLHWFYGHDNFLVICTFSIIDQIVIGHNDDKLYLWMYFLGWASVAKAIVVLHNNPEEFLWGTLKDIRSREFSTFSAHVLTSERQREKERALATGLTKSRESIMLRAREDLRGCSAQILYEIKKGKEGRPSARGRRRQEAYWSVSVTGIRKALWQ